MIDHNLINRYLPGKIVRIKTHNNECDDGNYEIIECTKDTLVLNRELTEAQKLIFHKKPYDIILIPLNTIVSIQEVLGT